MSPTWLEEMPYAVISIDEFEMAAGVTSAVGIMDFWSGKLSNTEKRRWPFRSYCYDDFADKVAALPDLFHGQYEAMFSGVAG